MKIIIFFLAAASYLSAELISIPHEYRTIQAGIDHSADGDTVLVYPGIYYENLNFSGRHIVLASRYLIYEAPEMIDSTIIDGGMTDRVIRIQSGESENTMVSGFTLQNGSGGIKVSGDVSVQLRNLIIRSNEREGYGAGIHISDNSVCIIQNTAVFDNRTTGSYSGTGIYVNDSDVTMEEVLVFNNLNEEGDGGGMAVFNSSVTMERCRIFRNQAFGNGGGLYCSESSIYLSRGGIHQNTGSRGGGIYLIDGSTLSTDAVFSPSVYDNHAHHGRDLYSDSYQSCALDTATVYHLTGYHILPEENFDLEVNAIYYEQYMSDRYVASDGDDSNDGRSWETPLKTIDHALRTLLPSGASVLTIRLADGVYGPSGNGESFPLGWISHVALAGSTTTGTVLDAENTHRILEMYDVQQAEVSSLTLTNAEYLSGGGMDADNSTVIGNDLLITGNTVVNNGAGIRLTGSSVTLNNCVVTNNTGGDVCGGIFNHSYSSLNLNGCIMYNNSGYHIYTDNHNTSVLIEYSDIFGGPYQIAGSEYHVVWEDGNINADPFFCDGTGGSLGVAENSPCLGAGFQGADMGGVSAECDSMPTFNGPVWYVDDDNAPYPGDGQTESPLASIADALSAAGDGDTIIVAPGRYNQALDLTGKSVFLTSNIYSEFSEETIFQTVLDGFEMEQSSLITMDSEQELSSTIQGFLIENCISLPGGPGCLPALMRISGNVSPLLKHLVIRNNHCACPDDGSLIRVSGNARPVFERVLIHDNESLIGSPVFAFNDLADVQMINITMAQNYCQNLEILVADQSRLTVLNAIIRNEMLMSNNSDISATYSNFLDYMPGEGNISLDPMFSNPEEFDFTLAENSPCIDTGDHESPPDHDGS